MDFRSYDSWNKLDTGVSLLASCALPANRGIALFGVVRGFLFLILPFQNSFGICHCSHQNSGFGLKKNHSSFPHLHSFSTLLSSRKILMQSSTKTKKYKLMQFETLDIQFMLNLHSPLLSYIVSYHVNTTTTAPTVPINPPAPHIGAPNTVAAFSSPFAFVAAALAVAEVGVSLPVAVVELRAGIFSSTPTVLQRFCVKAIVSIRIKSTLPSRTRKRKNGQAPREEATYWPNPQDYNLSAPAVEA